MAKRKPYKAKSPAEYYGLLRGEFLDLLMALEEVNAVSN